jgi:hypothetical protein
VSEELKPCRTTWNDSDCFTHRRAYEKCLGLCGCPVCQEKRKTRRTPSKESR